MKKIKELIKSKKALIIGAAILGIIAIGAITTFAAGRSGSACTVPHSVLAKTDLANTISVSGNVKSGNVQHVYSTLSYAVKDIYVSVGDQVAAGDPLARLDTVSLEMDIAQQRNSINNSQKTLAIDLENKKRIYQNMKSQYENGLNAEFVNAQTTYENNKILFEADAISKLEFDQSEINYQSIKTRIEQDIKTAEANLSMAQANYDDDSQKIALQKLEKNLADALIKAPVAGTVTAVYAVAGSPGSGLLFVIEDTENLIITAYVKEYDAGQVYPGQLVTIKSDATGDEVINGEVISISPASTKNAAGETHISSTVEFETEVAISDPHPDLKIGMNTRLNIILEKKNDVYAAPYDAVTTNAAGQTVVYSVSKENGKQIVQELAVETGMETDFYTEVSGAGLSDGVIIINDAAGVKPGDAVELQPAAGRR